MEPQANQHILDVGGYPGFWSTMDCQGPIVCVNLDAPNNAAQLSSVTFVRGDGRHLAYRAGEFDIVFSNSVIEHLGTWVDQNLFANEIRRVGQAYWVQTPNRWFPVEPHLLTLFVHYLPHSCQRYLLRYATIWGLITRPTRKQVAAFLAEVRLLSEREMRMLFPDAEIITERFFGFKKSFIAVRRSSSKITGK